MSADYWHERMAERMPLADEVARLVTVLKGFYLDEQRDYATLLDFYSNAERPYGNKNVEQSIAFNLGWDRDRVLREHSMPEWVAANARELHRLVGVEIQTRTPSSHDLTPSEVAFAKMLAAWEEWPGPNGSPGDIDEALGDVGDRLAAVDMFDHGRLTEAGRALLDRARKAGVL